MVHTGGLVHNEKATRGLLKATVTKKNDNRLRAPEKYWKKDVGGWDPLFIVGTSNQERRPRSLRRDINNQVGGLK